MEIEVLRIGQRVVRDDRVTTHVALVSRAFGAKKIFMNEINPEIKETLDKINSTWG
ncbi:MAG: tRNA (cytidine(56)-2'-O)-methyltransferase, partial [Nitrosopumilaceae archaeon]|nr:tRNA (cytidine(56)-2'-O)-methyltransferase [Nitrosopumilaceae archaeon]